MFTAEEATKERVDAYVAALQREKEGLEARVKALKDGKHEQLSEDQLAARLKGVVAEITRVKKTKAAKAEDE